jgi:opacity protein-like surface antigen
VRRATLSLTLLALLVAGASRAGADGIDLRIGGLFPRGHETLFQDLNALYGPNEDPAQGVKPADFRGVYGGIEYNRVLLDNVELAIHLDGYGRTVESSYRDYTWDDGTEIRQSLKLTMVPLGVSLRFVPTGKRTKIAPFIGGGVDAIFYKYEERGDFVCFPPASGTCRFDYDVVPDAFVSESTAFGYHVLGGLRVYINHDFAVVAEGRYQWAKDDMGDDFTPNEPGLVNTLDLSGWTFTVGAHVRF